MRGRGYCLRGGKVKMYDIACLAMGFVYTWTGHHKEGRCNSELCMDDGTWLMKNYSCNC